MKTSVKLLFNPLSFYIISGHCQEEM